MNLNFKLILFSAAIFITFQVSAQNGNSPYSVLGLGDISSPGYIRNMAMGGTGVSNGNPEFINIQNPALLHINKFQNLDLKFVFYLID